MNPIGKLKDTAIDAIKDPLGAAGKVVEQARGTAALGLMVVEQIGKVALEKAGEVVGRGTDYTSSGGRTDLRPVPEVNEPAHTAEPAKRQGDPVTTAPTPVATPPAAKKAPPAKKAASKKAAAKKAAPPKKAAPTETAAVGLGEIPTPADVAKQVAKKAPAKKGAAKKAPVKGGPGAEQAPTTQSTPGDRLPPRKRPAPPKPAATPAAKKAPAKKAPAKKARPKTAEQVAGVQGEDVATPVGTPGAGRGHNPDTTDTGLQQPDTAPLMDPSLVKAIKSESEMMQKDADLDKG
jgi:hypothetical protein